MPRSVFFLLFCLIVLSGSCLKQEKPFFVYLHKSVNRAPYDFEADKVSAKRSQNLITIDASGRNEPYRYKITLPKNITEGGYDESNQNIFFNCVIGSITSYSLKISEINSKGIKGSFEGQYMLDESIGYELINGKFYAKFVK